MDREKININEIITKCNEIIALAENYRTTGDRLFEISTDCTPDVLSMDEMKIQEMIDDVALNLKSTYLKILSITNEVKTESIRVSELQNTIRNN